MINKSPNVLAQEHLGRSRDFLLLLHNPQKPYVYGEDDVSDGGE